MTDALIDNIAALLGGVVPAIVIRYMCRNGVSNFRWIPWVSVSIVVAILLQYLILVEPRPSYSVESDEVKAAVEAATEAADKIIQTADALAPSDSPEFHPPSWNYYYNDGNSYVEGYSEVRLLGNKPDYQYKIFVKCMSPDTLHLVLSDGYRDYRFSTEDSSRGSVTPLYAYVDNDPLNYDRKVRVVDGTAVLPVDNVATILSKGALLKISLIARTDRDTLLSQTAIFVLTHFKYTWDECT